MTHVVGPINTVIHITVDVEAKEDAAHDRLNQLCEYESDNECTQQAHCNGKLYVTNIQAILKKLITFAFAANF